MLKQSAEPLKTPAGSPPGAPLPWRLYGVEALASAGTNLMISAIFFYTKNHLHWTLQQNFLLASGQGLFYIAGAMTAGPVARRLNQKFALALVYLAMAALALLAFAAGARPWIVTILLLIYSYCSTIGWPMMESLVSTGVDSHELSRRVGIYNAVWATVGAAVFCVCGKLIEFWPAGIFALPAAVHGLSSLAMFVLDRSSAAAATDSTSHPPSHAEPEPELLRVRTLALWLSRVALPATYVAIFSLLALMPSLPIVQPFSPLGQTTLCSLWMGTRLIAFLVLGAGTWWHTRPRLLLVSAIVMLVTFFGITVRPSDLFGHGSFAIDLACMIVAQLALGVAMGMIYCASLYFGMVLSDGSTEHGGYHEALIGIGFVIGPGAGAVAQFMQPGNSYAGIVAVGGVVLLSVLAVAMTAVMGNRLETG